MRLSDIVGQRLADIIHSPASTYTSGATSVLSGVGTLLNPHNVVFIIGTFGGLLFAWMTYRSRKRRDDEMTRLDRERTLAYQRMSDAFVNKLATTKDSLKDIDNAPEVVKNMVEEVSRKVFPPELDRRGHDNVE